MLKGTVSLYLFCFHVVACISSNGVSGWEECALFRDPSIHYVKENGPSFIKLDTYDFTGDLGISFWVLPDKDQHDGPLFSMGTEDNFRYYEWKTKAVKTQYFVIEISSGEVSALLKAEGTHHLHQLQLYSTWPVPYDLSTGYWQYIHAYRYQAVWGLALNETIKITQDTEETSDVNLYGRHGFLGGRPDYDAFAFRGIISNLQINGEPVRLSGHEMEGNAEVYNCDSSEVRHFIQEITTA